MASIDGIFNVPRGKGLVHWRFVNLFHHCGIYRLQAAEYVQVQKLLMYANANIVK